MDIVQLQQPWLSVDRSAALEASSITKNAPGRLRQIYGRLDSTAPTGTYYFQILNASSVPADGAVSQLVTPLKIYHVNGTDTMFNLDFTECCIYASTGLVWCLSSTEFTKTLSGAYVSATALYK